MANSTSGKWVSSVGASGGGKAYKKARPSNYYALLVLIVVVGLASVTWARYDYQHPSAAPAGTPPTIGTTWDAALAIDVCGVPFADLTTDPTYKGGFTVKAHNVIQLSPASSADSGNHATLAQFANEYPGLIISNSEIAIPNSSGVAKASTTYHNGELCPAGTKYAKQAAQVKYAYWTSLGQKVPKMTTNPNNIKFSQYVRITLAFLPKGAVPVAPTTATVNAMVSDGLVVTTTTVPATTTTLPLTTTTVAPTTTTTTKG